MTTNVAVTGVIVTALLTYAVLRALGVRSTRYGVIFAVIVWLGLVLVLGVES